MIKNLKNFFIFRLKFPKSVPFPFLGSIYKPIFYIGTFNFLKCSELKIQNSSIFEFELWMIISPVFCMRSLKFFFSAIRCDLWVSGDPKSKIVVHRNLGANQQTHGLENPGYGNTYLSGASWTDRDQTMKYGTCVIGIEIPRSWSFKANIYYERI